MKSYFSTTKVQQCELLRKVIDFNSEGSAIHIKGFCGKMQKPVLLEYMVSYIY